MHAGLIAVTVLVTLLTFPLAYFAVISIMDLFETSPNNKCKNNTDCNDWEECVDSSCLLICRNKICKTNEHCVTYIHNYTCECLPGFIRDEKSHCYLSVIKPYLRKRKK